MLISALLKVSHFVRLPPGSANCDWLLSEPSVRTLRALIKFSMTDMLKATVLKVATLAHSI
jgi:hypothetical protein